MAAITASHKLLDPCGRFLPALLIHDLVDRLTGKSDRARARWGAIERPAATGKLLWIAAGEDRDSVRLGVELVRAVSARRTDLSITLTVETEYPDLLARLESASRIAWSFAPADYAGSMQAVWRRLLPFGMIVAGMTPRPNLLRLCGACRHSMLVAPPGFTIGRYERIYPGHRQTFEGRNVAPAADLDVLMLPTSTPDDGRLTGLLAGRTAFLWHGSDEAQARRVFAMVRGRLPQSLMFASGPVVGGLRRHATETIALGDWPGQPVPPDKLVLVDTPDAFAAMATGLTAAHFETADRPMLWQSLAAGARVSATCLDWIEAPSARNAAEFVADENALVDAWRILDADEVTRQEASRASRQAFNTACALARNVVGDLLARVGSWQ